MVTVVIHDNDPDVLWIQLRSALRDGRLADAAEAQKKLREVGISVQINCLEVKRDSGVPRC